MDPSVHLNDGYVAPPDGASCSSNSPPVEDISHRSSQHQVNYPVLAPDTNIILCISPALGSACFGYVYAAENECHLQAALMAYFDSSGCTVAVFPFPNFDAFMANNAITNSNIDFISNLPSYIIPTGNRILEAVQYDKLPNQDWLPAPWIFQALLQAPLLLLFYRIADLVELLFPVAQMIPNIGPILATAQTPKALMSPTSLAHPPTTVPCKFPPLSWGLDGILWHIPHYPQGGLLDIAYLTIHVDAGAMAFT
jgi:hypothetical protein